MSRFSTLLVLLFSLGASGQGVIHSLVGNGAGDGFGASMAGLGDVDGDSVPDLAVGIPLGLDGAGVETGTVTVYSGASWTPIYSVHGSLDGDRFGSEVAAVGDIDGDGITDLGVGADGADPNGDASGLVRLLSGATGALIHEFQGAVAGDIFGFSIAGGEDVDGDGTLDVIIGAIGADFLPSGAMNPLVNVGSATVFSGSTFAPLNQVYGTAPGDQLGRDVLLIPDVDGDNAPDFVTSAHRESGSSGAVHIWSGATGANLHSEVGASGDQFGWALAAPGDLDGDGIPEVAASGRLADGSGVDRGELRVFSAGGTHAVLFSIFGDRDNALFGISLSAAGDVNGDGTRDLLVCSANSDPGGFGRVLSGVDGSEIQSTYGALGEQMGTACTAMGDVDGDGKDDVVASSRHAGGNNSNSGEVRVFQEVLLNLAMPANLTLGSALNISLSTAPPQPFTAYIFDLGYAGDVPGLAMGPPIGAVFPVNPPLLYLTYQNTPAAGFFSGFWGILDASGNATATMTVPFLPILTGLRLYGGAVTLDPSSPLLVDRVSNGANTLLQSPTPAITGVSPASGTALGGDSITINGSLFVSGSSVTIGGLAATGVTVQDPNTILCVTPGGPAGPADVVVTSSTGQSATLPGGFNYLPVTVPPAITGLVPADGPFSGGSTITVQGSGFSAGTQLFFDGVAAPTVVFVDPQTLEVTTPPGTAGTTVNVQAVNPDTQSATLPNAFAYLADLVITAISNPGPAVGTVVTLTGDGFQAGLSLDVAGVATTASSITTTSVTFTMPAGAGCDALVTVTNPSTQVATIGVNASPIASSLLPAAGPTTGLISIFIFGSGFVPGSTVTVGGNAATITQLTPTIIQIDLPPASAAGPVDLVVTLPSGCTATRSFNYF